MEQLKSPQSRTDSTRLSHPLIVKMGGRQWVVGGDYTTPVETDLSDKLISLSSWSHPSEISPRNVLKTQGIHRLWNGFIDKLGFVLDRIVGTSAVDGGEDGAGVQAAVRRGAHTDAGRGRRRAADAFQIGMIFGLVLGCLSLLVFHQMEPGRAYDTPVSANHDRAVFAGSHPGFTLPALELYTFQTRPFGNAQDAQRMADSLAKQNIPAIVHSGSRPTVWCGIAIHAGALNQMRDKLVHLKVNASLYKIAWNAQSVPGPGGQSTTDLQTVSQWLSASAGSVKTLVAVLSDGGLPRDAEQAHTTAQSLQPSLAVLAATGFDTELTRIAKTLNESVDAFHAKHGLESTQAVMSACESLARIATAAETGT